MGKLYIKGSSLDGVHAEVEADFSMLVLSEPAMIAEAANAIRYCLVVGCDSAAISESSEILTRVEAETSYVAKRAGTAIKNTGSVCLGGVFNQMNTFLLADCFQFERFGGLPVKMNGNHGPAFWPYNCLNLTDVH